MSTPEHALRVATDDDFQFIHGLRAEAYRSYVDALLGGWDEAWQRNHLRQAWDKRARWIIVLDGDDAGYLDLAQGAHVHLGNVIVAPAYRGLGVGTQVILDVLDVAESQGKSVRLQVFRSNPAVSLYRRLGFVVEETTDTQLMMVWPGLQPTAPV